MNTRQQITAASYGSSLSASYGYDSYGYPASASAGTIMGYEYNFDADDAWLNNRRNTKHSGCYESFTYDNLERLDHVKDTLDNVLLDMDYSANGNITKKTDVSNVSFGYNNSSKPYALTDIEAVTGLISDSLQTVAYTSFEQPSSITENPYQATFLYNSDEQRAKMLVTNSGNTILTRWYAGSRYMKETAGSITKEYTYLGGDAYTAPAVAVTQSGTTTYYYLLRDHLGTITHLVNTSNVVVSEYSFDAWGRRRVANDWDNYNVSSEPELFAGRGFTGHEYLPWFSLVNMNGRLYDPVVGRFLSPDENVSFSGFTQSYNRYSYALNNPLSITDPDGENPLIILGAILGGWMGMGQAMINSDKQGWGLVGDMAKGLFVGAAAGAWAGGAVAGSLGVSSTFGGSVVNGAISGAAGGFAGGFVGGAGGAWMNGANFGQGIQSGFIGGSYGAIGGAVIGGISGGIQHLNRVHSFNMMNDGVAMNGKRVVYSNENAKLFSDNRFGEQKGLTNLYADGTLPPGSNSDALGITRQIDNSRFSNVYLKEAAFSSKWKLFNVMGHEYVHVAQIYSGLPLHQNFMEVGAYAWNDFVHELEGKTLQGKWLDQYMLHMKGVTSDLKGWSGHYSLPLITDYMYYSLPTYKTSVYPW